MRTKKATNQKAQSSRRTLLTVAAQATISLYSTKSESISQPVVETEISDCIIEPAFGELFISQTDKKILFGTDKSDFVLLNETPCIKNLLSGQLTENPLCIDERVSLENTKLCTEVLKVLPWIILHRRRTDEGVLKILSAIRDYSVRVGTKLHYADHSLVDKALLSELGNLRDLPRAEKRNLEAIKLEVARCSQLIDDCACKVVDNLEAWSGSDLADYAENWLKLLGSPRKFDRDVIDSFTLKDFEIALSIATGLPLKVKMSDYQKFTQLCYRVNIHYIPTHDDDDDVLLISGVLIRKSSDPVVVDPRVKKLIGPAVDQKTRVLLESQSFIPERRDEGAVGQKRDSNWNLSWVQDFLRDCGSNESEKSKTAENPKSSPKYLRARPDYITMGLNLATDEEWEDLLNANGRRFRSSTGISRVQDPHGGSPLRIGGRIIYPKSDLKKTSGEETLKTNHQIANEASSETLTSKEESITSQEFSKKFSTTTTEITSSRQTTSEVRSSTRTIKSSQLEDFFSNLSLEDRNLDRILVVKETTKSSGAASDDFGTSSVSTDATFTAEKTSSITTEASRNSAYGAHSLGTNSPSETAKVPVADSRATPGPASWPATHTSEVSKISTGAIRKTSGRSILNWISPANPDVVDPPKTSSIIPELVNRNESVKNLVENWNRASLGESENSSKKPSLVEGDIGGRFGEIIIGEVYKRPGKEETVLASSNKINSLNVDGPKMQNNSIVLNIGLTTNSSSEAHKENTPVDQLHSQPHNPPSNLLTSGTREGLGQISAAQKTADWLETNKEQLAGYGEARRNTGRAGGERFETDRLATSSAQEEYSVEKAADREALRQKAYENLSGKMADAQSRTARIRAARQELANQYAARQEADASTRLDGGSLAGVTSPGRRDSGGSSHRKDNTGIPRLSSRRSFETPATSNPSGRPPRGSVEIGDMNRGLSRQTSRTSLQGSMSDSGRSSTQRNAYYTNPDDWRRAGKSGEFFGPVVYNTTPAPPPPKSFRWNESTKKWNLSGKGGILSLDEMYAAKQMQPVYKKSNERKSLTRRSSDHVTSKEVTGKRSTSVSRKATRSSLGSDRTSRIPLASTSRPAETISPVNNKQKTGSKTTNTSVGR